MSERLSELLHTIYGPEKAMPLARHLRARLLTYQSRLPEPTLGSLSQRDAVLITYGDMVWEGAHLPLQTLAHFLEAHLKDIVNTVHLLPFYPYSSDDGFSVINYLGVDPALGTWGDVERLSQSFRLMFDAVINHISVESDWFQAFLRGQSPYADYFITVDPDTDLSQVFRPRALPLLTPFETQRGLRHVWTTFSSDQADLNYAEPRVLLDVLDVILTYVARGAALLRLDAIAYLWKEPGTPSIHLPQTHAIIQLIRAVLDKVAPHVALVTETNVPHEENISYFGDGHNEAQMVYNFSLPPLTLHAFHRGDARTLTRWAGTLTLPSRQVTFFNFLASHDGIGLMPARQLLPKAEIAALAERAAALGGHISYRTAPDGAKSPYELNINYLDALGDPDRPDESPAREAQRFLTAQAIMLALRGVPGIYFHSLFGSRGWPAGVEQTGRLRTINRQKLQRRRLQNELAQPGHLRRLVFEGYVRLLAARKANPAFNPYGGQTILHLHPAVFTLARTSTDGRHSLLALHNVSAESHRLAVRLRETTVPVANTFVDVLSGRPFTAGSDDTLELSIQPYGVVWLQPLPDKP
ncbi:MAG: sugar phosphorylase [Candidatus Promineifilaceae bacterium]|nr:sugar phosphorylase [Candidatus Promineifilaceae bacterium]